MSMAKVLDETSLQLHRIIPFSNVEGQGNRCSVFLQGCNINCLYCHNPETIAPKGEGSKTVTLRYILDEVKNSMPFIRGATFSGGEPTIHHRQLVPLFKEIRKLGLTCYLDSNGFFDFDTIKDLIEVTDKFLFDIKGIGFGLEKLCFDQQNQSGKVSDNVVKPSPIMARNILNLEKLLPLDKIEEVRLVHILNYYNPYKTVEAIVKTILPYPNVLFKLIRVHGKGARDEQGILKNMPSVQQHQQLADFARQLGQQNIVVIQ